MSTEAIWAVVAFSVTCYVCNIFFLRYLFDCNYNDEGAAFGVGFAWIVSPISLPIIGVIYGLFVIGKFILRYDND